MTAPKRMISFKTADIHISPCFHTFIRACHRHKAYGDHSARISAAIGAGESQLTKKS
jgi:hypothetical protein